MVRQTAGGTVITGADINLFQMKTQMLALKMEEKGLKRRGPSAFSIVKQAYKLSGSRTEVIVKFGKVIAEYEANLNGVQGRST